MTVRCCCCCLLVFPLVEEEDDPVGNARDTCTEAGTKVNSTIVYREKSMAEDESSSSCPRPRAELWLSPGPHAVRAFTGLGLALAFLLPLPPTR